MRVIDNKKYSRLKHRYLLINKLKAIKKILRFFHLFISFAIITWVHDLSCNQTPASQYYQPTLAFLRSLIMPATLRTYLYTYHLFIYLTTYLPIYYLSIKKLHISVIERFRSKPSLGILLLFYYLIKSSIIFSVSRDCGGSNED